MKKLKAVFAGGGTGGHLFPAITIADRMKSRIEPDMTADFLFVGTRRGLEYRMRDRLGCPLALINVMGLKRSLTLTNLLFPILLIGAFLKSLFILSRFKPDIVIGTGGYVMAPVVLAAVLLNVPRVIQEQNSYPGLATRKLASRVNKIFLGFGAAAGYLKNKSIVVETGNPVKEIIGTISRMDGIGYFDLDNDKKTIFILGGSQGASIINHNILRNLRKLPDSYQLIWQTGERDYKEVAAVAGGRVKSRALFPFIDSIEMAYAAADLVIARSGALTLAEITAAALPSILIPYPFAAGNHQMKNALTVLESGAATIVENEKLEQVNLLEEAIGLFKSGQIEKMADASVELRSARSKPASDMIVDEILELINIKKE